MPIKRHIMVRHRAVVAMMVGVGMCIVMGKKYSQRREGWGPKKVHIRPGFYNRSELPLNASTPEVLRYWGYPAETHEVKTVDGYVLTVHRIPQELGSRKGVILLQHGLLCSSADWVINPPYQALGYALFDAGYDVWLGNVRGNTYCRKHVKLRTKDPKFWKFSWDEVGMYDLPATIDYILQETKEKSIQYVGHSMGTTAFFVMMDRHPEYNKKIASMYALAPVAYLANIKSPVLRALVPYSKEIDEFSFIFGHGEFLSNGKAMKLFAAWGCDLNRIEERLCEKLIFIFGGAPNPNNFNTSMIPWILGHTPAGTSSHTVLHYGQEVISKKFCAFDYGEAGNKEHYNQATPPEYDLSKVTVPVIAFWGANDWLSVPKDLERTLNELGNLKQSIQVEDPKFNHLDFLYGINARKLVYEKIIKSLEKY